MTLPSQHGPRNRRKFPAITNIFTFTSLTTQTQTPNTSNNYIINRQQRRTKSSWFIRSALCLLTLSLFLYQQQQKQYVLMPNPNSKAKDHAKSKQGEEGEEVNKLHTKMFDQQTEWILNNFRSADPSEQEWCVKALTQGNHWKQTDYNGGSQYGADGFFVRNIFWDYVVRSKKGFYVEAGANDYRTLSSTFLFDKCFGWEGLCVEPQQRYQHDLVTKRSCKTVRSCLTKEKTQMMIGGMPANRGAGAFIKPIPDDGVIPDRFEKVECAPLQDFLGSRTHVDLFVLDVEGHELPVLDTIDWHNITFSALQIETNKIKLSLLNEDMSKRGFEELYSITDNSVYVPAKERFKYPNSSEAWQPPGNIVGLKQGD